MPNHVILDRLWKSDKLAGCSMPAQLHYPRLYLLCDDWACFEIDVFIIRGEVYPKMPKISVKQIEGWLKEYSDSGLLFRWFIGSSEYGYWTGSETVRLMSPSRRHKRKTPEPNTNEHDAYLQNYKETTESLQNPPRAGAEPVPVLVPEPNPFNVRFEKFWKEYPRKDAKQRAVESWEKVNPDDTLAEKITNAIIAAVKAKVWSSREYTPLPSTWLNQQRWTDELDSNTAQRPPDKWKNCPDCGYTMTAKEKQAGKCEKCREESV